MATTLAIDFGTSNSAAAVLDGGETRRLPIEAAADTLPTAVFFPVRGKMRIGEAASRALITGEEGRYMRALKSVLGTPLLHEERPIGGRRQSIADVITAYLAEVKSRAEALTGQRFTHALSGRPVHFHSSDPARDAQAEKDLRACYHAADFETVDFLFEPEAAAIANHGLGGASGVGLIVDIGGGTSDFSVFETHHGQAKILASHGIRLGGTDFDQALSMSHVMPLLGLGGELRREFGPGRRPVPRAIFADLATWSKIPFLYTGETRREAARLQQSALDPMALERLNIVLKEELGHQLAFSVEAGKIAANADQAGALIKLSEIESGLTAPISGQSMDASLAAYRRDLAGAAAETLRQAAIATEQVSAIILVGGSSLMELVQDEMRRLCPNADLKLSEAFTAVVDGLALAGASGPSTS